MFESDQKSQIVPPYSFETENATIPTQRICVMLKENSEGEAWFIGQ